MSVSFLMLLLLGVLSGDASAPPRDLLSLLDAQATLQQAGVATDDESLVAMLSADDHEVGVDALKAAVANLKADDFAVRERASEELAAAGPAALPLLAEAAKSGDPEVVARARKAAEAIRAREAAALPDDVALMLAVRILEKRKAQAALPGLEMLAKSDDEMLAAVAGGAIAVIREGALPARDPRPALAEILKSLPDAPVAVAALNMAADASDMALGERLDAALAAKEIQQFARMMPPAMRDQMFQGANSAILNVLRTVGNVRVDGAVLHVPETVAEPIRHQPYVGLVIKGLYSPSRVAAVCEEAGMECREGDGPPVYTNRDVVLGLIDSKTLAVAFVTSGVENALPFVWTVSDGPGVEPAADAPAAKVAGMLMHGGARIVGAGRLTDFQKKEGIEEAIAKLQRGAEGEQEVAPILEGMAAVLKGLLTAEGYTVAAGEQKALVTFSYGEGEEGQVHAAEAGASMKHGLESARQGITVLARQMGDGTAEKMIAVMLKDPPIVVDTDGSTVILKAKGAVGILPMMMFGLAVPARAAAANGAMREVEAR